ncbi:MAG TPA: hypothetical protein VLI05_06040 [Candidatus Saccharimonadia bacterium]|nr:hypothetical protein [Candidatus Saccharimonadia bacterium]
MRRAPLFSTLVLAGLIGLGSLMPLKLVVSPAGVAVASQTVLAAGVTSEDCIPIAVQLIKTAQDGCPAGTISNKAPGGAIVAYLKTVLQFLSGGIGLVILLMMVIAGAQYITSAGDPGLIKAAKTRLINAITALLLFLLAFAIINFIVPGGVLG